MRYKLGFYTMFLALAVMPVAISAQESGNNNDSDTLVYEKPSIQNLSRLYWRLSKFTPDQDFAVDNFMRINECDIYKDYYHNEFEWRTIRESSRKFLQEQQKTFPLRFQFVQPLSLGEYDFEKKGFHVLDEYKLNAIRRFQVFSDDTFKNICGEEKYIQGYPRGILLELSRPIDFDFIPMEERRAKVLVDEKIKAFNTLKDKQKTTENLYAFRDAVMVMYVKAFSLRPEQQDKRSADGNGYYTTDVLAVLEGVEVYADKKKEKLIYHESYLRKKKQSTFERKLKEKFEKQKQLKAEQGKAEETDGRSAPPKAIRKTLPSP